jgi:23S rRNA pseudouridine1911/1915/1917 synthase
MPAELEILHEDNHCLVVNKPAGLLVQGDRTGDRSLADVARAWIKQRHAKTGNVYLGVVHRLDRPVSGIVLLARTSKATSRLAAAFRDRKVVKTYRAIVERPPEVLQGRLVHHLLKDPASNTTHIVEASTPGARRAVLRYQVLQRVAAGTLVEVIPETGRPHQIRVQMAAVAGAIVGDLRYGSRTALGERIALHATHLAFPHPTRQETIDIHCEVPQSWAELLGSGPVS